MNTLSFIKACEGGKFKEGNDCARGGGGGAGFTVGKVNKIPGMMSADAAGFFDGVDALGYKSGTDYIENVSDDTFTIKSKEMAADPRVAKLHDKANGDWTEHLPGQGSAEPKPPPKGSTARYNAVGLAAENASKLAVKKPSFETHDAAATFHMKAGRIAEEIGKDDLAGIHAKKAGEHTVASGRYTARNRKSLYEFVKNCGTGPGGFEAGNNCGSGGGGAGEVQLTGNARAEFTQKFEAKFNTKQRSKIVSDIEKYVDIGEKEKYKEKIDSAMKHVRNGRLKDAFESLDSIYQELGISDNSHVLDRALTQLKRGWGDKTNRTVDGDEYVGRYG